MEGNLCCQTIHLNYNKRVKAVFDNSRVVVCVIHTNDELMIARTVCRVLGLGSKKEN
jgi:acetate kinase